MTNCRLLRLIVSLGMFFNLLVFAAEEEHYPVPNEIDIIEHFDHQDHHLKESEDFQSKFFNMLFVLALLIGFMIIASWALKRMMKTRLTHLNANSTLKVLETRSLSPRATLYLLETENEQLLIAESPNSVTLLSSRPLNHSEYSADSKYPSTAS